MQTTPLLSRFFLANEAATEALAQAMASPISSELSSSYGQKHGLASSYHLHLQGDLGAGKTAFCRAFLRALGVTGRIKSPTYTLVETYKVSRLYLYHFDFYRFNESTEWQEAGFREHLLENAVVLIEWPEKADKSLPQPDVLLQLHYHQTGRIAELHAYTDKGMAWIAQLKNQQNLVPAA
ncbi:tRNA (adenosine(37)-N6)-threonylcarbamoyltransferase complex ATPase subunit type 1 TsaE [Pelistega europaea]|uniref:tRNA threonylcarbamoyladenosine biosynthesis protein TsaE n=1 Tax=Pelistega europaea TaxID=106147 RepID=A0A7Y4L9L4_9BURK|nr:tRNA (adenosine(37)-N6)-threonylcarbamoyltransferase complex ATPase subunit type 1 TsaE [Pelistega europaea]NOL49525.1 tRNA (adenosine(37)-N6)-threonylcarbamoyltransferase complex ATPase subunit type 1 TsaE [Pelistega europaea]